MLSGMTYQDFIPPSPLDSLGRFEAREIVTVDGTDGDIDKRSVIRNSADGTQRWEIPRERSSASGPIHRCVFHRCADQGSIGWPKNFWLYCKQKVRGSFWPCMAHRYHSDANMAFTHSGNMILRAQTIVVFNLTSGPFKGDANMHTISDSHQEYCRLGGPSDQLFQLRFDRLAAACPATSAPYGSLEHAKEVCGARLRTQLCSKRSSTV